MNQEMSIVQLVLHASFVVQFVIVVLLSISIASWAAIVRKLMAIRFRATYTTEQVTRNHVARIKTHTGDDNIGVPHDPQIVVCHPGDKFTD